MPFSEDEEILQDFLVEAGEILELLSEQLVDLEQRPDDRALLNAIFRGFHTVKGGAGFLQLDTMVECCHATENLFDILRNGKREVTPALMDVVLQALDTINAQFRQISQREEPQRASADLMAKLAALVGGPAPAASHAPAKQTAASTPAVPPDDTGLELSDAEFEGFLDAIGAPPAASAPSRNATLPPSASIPASGASASGADEISEDEFESLLDKLHGSGKGPGKGAAQTQAPAAAPVPPPSVGGEEISEDEFEHLLDQLHGVGKGPGKSTATGGVSPPAETVVRASATAPAAPAPGAAGSDLITDLEFENLLDQLHGRGKGPSAGANSSAPAAKHAPAPVARDHGDEELDRVQELQAPKARESSTEKSRNASVGGSGNPGTGASSGAGTNSGTGSNNAAAQVETTVRVDTQRLDDIMNMVGELVLVRNRLVRLGMDSTDEALSKAVANLDVVTADLQTAVMKTRMQPIKKVFGRFPRVVRDLARSLKKEINLELVGEETDLDKNLVEALADPLVHLVRNSVDHGIELPSVREAHGKSRVGKVILAAEQEGDHILLSISDDGAGMDPAKLREKAVEKGILEPDAAARLTDVEAFNLIFAPGFSTKTEISDVSGRGVGMDVVKTKIAQLNGSIEIDSRKGTGTRISIKVPLTLAIMPTLMIMLGRQAFALPLVNVNEIFQMDLTKSHVVDGQECVTIRDKAIPIFHLKRWLVRGQHDRKKIPGAHVVIVTVGTRRVGFVVDQLIGQEEVVIKPLGKMLQGTPGMAGATITGDGAIALILDVPSLLKRYAGGV